MHRTSLECCRNSSRKKRNGRFPESAQLSPQNLVVDLDLIPLFAQLQHATGAGELVEDQRTAQVIQNKRVCIEPAYRDRELVEVVIIRRPVLIEHGSFSLLRIIVRPVLLERDWSRIHGD